MKQDLFSLNIRNLRLFFERKQAQQSNDINNDQGNVQAINFQKKFTFSQQLTIDKQITKFKSCLQSGQWNGKLAFSGFKGAFKMEYWGIFEESLRQISGLTKMIFVETKLDNLHLTLLKSFIQWVDPSEISLKFIQNEMDDKDLDEFLLKGLLPSLGHKIQTFQVVSNPGIFKGHFVRHLKESLAKMTSTNQQYNYHFVKNKEYKSIGFIRIAKITQKVVVDAQLLKLQISLQKTFYYKFSFQKCFTESNQKAFQHLIELSYHEDKLEQIESLDVGECNLGSAVIFDKMCKKISTSKGLLSFGLNKQTHMCRANILTSLMGDRYDQLRINHIDIGNNQEILEKGMKILADNLLSKSIKTLNIDGSFNQHLPVLLKLITIIDALMIEIEGFKKIMKNEQYIPRAMIKQIDLSKLDQYNRHDLIKGLLLATVFNEFSDCKELIIQNLDCGRLQAYLDSLSEFEAHIIVLKKENLFCQNFLPKLSNIGMYAQKYRMESKLMEELFKRLFFTQSSDLLQIQSIVMKTCFTTTNRENALEDFLISLNILYQQNPNVQFTLKHLKLMKSQGDEEKILSLIFQNILFCKNFSLESLILIDENFTDEEGSKFLTCAEEFLPSIPLESYMSLKILTFESLIDGGLDPMKLVELLIFTDKVRIEELTLLKFKLICDDQTTNSVKEKADGWNQILALKKLQLGGFTDSNNNIESSLIEILVIHPMSQICDLTLEKLIIQESLIFLRDKIVSEQEKGHTSMITLKSLSLNNLVDYTEDQWELVGDIFIYANDISLDSLQYKDIRISSAMVQGLHKSITKRQDYLTKINMIDLESGFSLKSLKFDGCTFQDDIFSLKLSTQKKSIQILHIKDCVDLDIAIKLFKFTYESSEEFKDIVNFQIHDLLLDGTILESDELFEWFFRNIILNKKTQQLKILSMKSCKLKDQNFDVINNILKEIKNYNLAMAQKQKCFYMNEFIFDDNNQISYKNWRDFFDNLFTVKTSITQEKNIDLESEDIEIKILEEEHKYQEKIELKDKKCEEITKFIVENRLSIPQKMLANPNSYVITSPIQLNRFELNVNFENENQEVKQRLYNRIISGLIYFKGSQLKELKLTKVDLPLFLISSKLSFLNFTLYDKGKIPLEKLELITVQNETEESLKTFAELYILNEQISLQGLIIDTIKTGNFILDMTQCIQESLSKDQICSLKILQLKDVCCNLDIEQTLQFFKTVVFNKKVPLTSINLAGDLTIVTGDEFQQIINCHLIEQNYSCTLTSFSISLTSDIQETVSTMIRLFPILVDGVLIKLQQLSYIYLSSTQPLSLFENLSDDNKYINFTINDLNLDFYMNMTLAEFKFFYNVRPKLLTLKLQKLSTKFISLDEINEFLLAENEVIYQKKRLFTPSTIILKFLDNVGEGKELMEKFVFGPAFKWDQVTLIGAQASLFFEKISFADTCLQGGDTIRHLRYLKINLGLVFNSSGQMSESSLMILGEQLIYNQRSILEELCLVSCHLKLPGLTALTSGAQAFRDKIEQSKEQQTTSLSLKRFQMYYSLYIMDEGAELINKDILFFEYITMESIEVTVTNWNDKMSISHCKHGLAWLQFQELHKRHRPHFSLKYINWGRNEFVQTQEAWNLLCDTFIFSDHTPYLEVISIHFMSLKDLQIDWICQKADDFFRWKPFNYVYPVKRLNFQLNTALSTRGWKEVTERFFFCKHINLEELNLMSTMLDTQEKLDAIFLGAHKKAQEQKTKKIPLHTLLTYNISLKQRFQEIMSIRPDNYQPLKDQSVEIDQCYQTGIIDGIPESFGQTTSIITKTLYQAHHITNTNKWKEECQTRFSEYHLDIASGLLKSLSEFFVKNREYCGHFPIDLTSCDELCTIFQYKLVNGDPYPYQLFFTAEACQFYQEPTCSIRVINFISTNHKNSEQVNQFQVLGLWELVKFKKTSLDVIYIDYKLDDDLVEAMINQGYNERDLVNLIRLFPPSQLRLQDTLTLQALKGIYSIMSDNQQFNYANILFDKDIFLNVGIGYSLREFVYRSNPSGCVGKYFKSVFYHIFNLFVSAVPKYSFTEQIRELNDFLSTQRRYFVILTLLTIVFYIICIFGPYGFQHHYAGDESFDIVCYNGMSSAGLYCFLVFAFFSFTTEAYLYWGVSQIIPNHIKGLIDTETNTDGFEQNDLNDYEPNNNRKVSSFQNNEKFSLDENKSSSQGLDAKQDEKINLMSTRNNIISTRHEDQQKKKQFSSQKTLKNITHSLTTKINNFAKSKKGRMLGYIKDLGIGQLAKFHLYTDVNFIMTCYYCRLNGLALLALVVTALNVYFQLYALVKFILTQCFQSNSKAKLISTQYINDFYEISAIGRNNALSTILDSVAPFNVTAIYNNFITRALVPQLAGKCMSNSVKGYLVKFTLEDVPQIILQLYFVIYRAFHPLSDPAITIYNAVVPPTGTLSVAIFLTIINTGVSLIVSFINFMSIRPSSLSQADFDALAQKKTKQFLTNQMSFVEKEFEILEALTGSFVKSKTIKDDDDELIIL